MVPRDWANVNECFSVYWWSANNFNNNFLYSILFLGLHHVRQFLRHALSSEPDFSQVLGCWCWQLYFHRFQCNQFAGRPSPHCHPLVVFQWWWQQYSAPASHSDCIIFNMVIIELLSVFTTISFYIADYTQLHIVMMVTSQLCFILICGQISFHILACLECYLAVVHPMIYSICTQKRALLEGSPFYLLGCLIQDCFFSSVMKISASLS